MGNIWLWLNDSHVDYATTIAALNVVTNEAEAGKGTGRMVEVSDSIDTIETTLGLSIGSAFTDLVLDIFYPDWLQTPHARWNSLKKTPTPITTDPEDRRVAYHRGLGSDTVIYIGQDDNGDGSGDSYINRRAVADFLSHDGGHTVNPDDYDLIVLAGRLHRHLGDGDQGGLVAGGGLYTTGGTVSQIQVVMSHPRNQATLYGGPKLGDGSWSTPSDWTLHDAGSGTYKIDISAASPSFSSEDVMCFSIDGGDEVVLKKVANAAAVIAEADTHFIDTTAQIIYVRLASGNNPKETTFIGGMNVGGIKLYAIADYLDFYGLRVVGTSYDAALIPKNSIRGGNIRIIGGEWGPTEHFFIEMVYNGVNLSTGQYSTLPADLDGVTVHGATILACSDGFYLASLGGYDGVPENIDIRDCWFQDVGAVIHGLNLERSDSHAVGFQGGVKGLNVHNNYFDRCQSRTVNSYGFVTTYNDPDAVIADAAITNGDFPTDVSGWTQVAGTVSHTTDGGGRMRLDSSGHARQAVTVGGTYDTNVHTLKWQASVRCYVSVGTTPGGGELFAETRIGGSDGNIEFTKSRYTCQFTPGSGVGTIYIDFRASDGQTDLDNIAIVTNLANEIGYTEALPAAQSIDRGDGTFDYYSPNRDVSVKDNIFNDVPESAITEDQVVALHGDNDWWGYNSQLGTVCEVKDNDFYAAAGAEPDVAIRPKWRSNSGAAADIVISGNKVRGFLIGMRTVSGNGIDASGNTLDPSFTFDGNDIEAKDYYVSLGPVSNPSFHEQLLGNVTGNTYRESAFSSAAQWRAGATDYATLALWEAAAPVGDVYDSQSSMEALSNLVGLLGLLGVGG